MTVSETLPAPRPPRKWLRRAVATLVVLAVFVAAGFAALPSILKSQLPKYVSTHYKRTLTLGEISINPFKLRVEVHDLKLAEADGRPIAGFAALVADLEWSSITRRAWHLAEVRLSEPTLLLDIAPDGRINLAELIDDLTRDSAKNASSTLPRLVIDTFTIEKGRADFTDRHAGYRNALAPFDLHVDHLSTLPQDRGPYTFSASTAHGGSLRWKGELTLNPISASGVVSGEGLLLPELSAYLKPYAAAGLSGGKAAFSLPYRLAYRDGRLDASVTDATLGIDDLAVQAEGAGAPFFALKTLRIGKISADYAKREAGVGEVQLDSGRLALKRDAHGTIDLLALLKAAPPAATAPPPAAAPAAQKAWQFKLGRLSLDNLSVALEDRTAAKPLSAAIERVSLHAGLEAQIGDSNRIALDGLDLGLHGLSLGSGAASAVKIGDISLEGGSVDLGKHSAHAARVLLGDGYAAVRRDRQGRIDLLDLLPGAGAPAVPERSAPPAAAWSASVDAVSLERFKLDLADEDTGIALHAQDIGAKLSDISSDPARPLKFSVGFGLREGGKLSASGKAVPAQSSMEASVAVERLALKPVQPLLARYVKLKLASGSVSAKGELALARPGGKVPLLRYAGSVDVADLRLNENSGVQFAAWKNVGASKLTLTLQPDRLEIPELRVAGLDAKLLINADHTLNATRLLVERPASREKTSAMFPVVVRRTRVQDATLEFSDLSLLPPFSTKIHELSGVVNGLSTNKRTRSQIELDGRVNEFGSARIRGELNPFAPLNNTDVALLFKNVDLVSASPYAMKFAGYRIASGKISLDLNYKFRDGKLEGRNNVVFDKLTLGEKVDSPQAMDLPLELAIAILTDSDGKIDLDLPVTGDLNNPQFSYGAVIWKAITSLIGRIVTAPFRALGALFGGGSGDNLDTIDFDPGRANLLPPEREKLKKVATMLSKRAQLKLSVPGSYNEEADGQALKVRGARLEVAQRAGVGQAAGEEPGPPDLQDRAVQQALRALLTERDGEAAWNKRKSEAEQATAASGAQITLLQRARRLTRGDPQVADLTPLYRGILERLIATQPLPPGALAELAMRRSGAVVEALKADGIESGRLAQTKAAKAAASSGRSVPLKLELSSR